MDVQENFRYFEAVIDICFPRMSPKSEAALRCLLFDISVSEVSKLFGYTPQNLYKMRKKYFESQSKIKKARKMLGVE